MDERKITIEIIGGGSGTNGSSPSSQSEEDSEQQKALKQKQDILRAILHPINTAEGAFFENPKHELYRNVDKQLYEQAKATTFKLVDYCHTRYFNLSEDYLGENQYNIIKGQLQKTSNVIQSVGNGIIQGLQFGIPGAVVGAALSGLSLGVQYSISNSQRWSSYHQQLNAVNFNTQFNSKRAGLYDGGRGTIE